MSARHLAALACAALLAGCTGGTPKGDAERGAKLHEACLDCHGTGLYTSPERKIKSLDALRRDVVRWGDYYNPAFTEQDVDDVTAFLNRDYYKFQ